MSRWQMIHPSRIEPHPGNIREDLGDLTELAASIRAQGILQPLVVQLHPDIPGRYQLLAGHRRLAAAKLARLDQVPAVVRQTEVTGPAAIEVMLVENLQRRDLGPVEKAEAMGALRRHGYTNAVIARALGITDATVGYYMALLDLSADALERVRGGELGVTEAVSAVRTVRARNRKRNGAAAVGASWEPDHFAAGHPLARRAAKMCEAREHTSRRRIGKIACGACWETAIRQDERLAAATLEAVS